MTQFPCGSRKYEKYTNQTFALEITKNILGKYIKRHKYLGE